MTGTKGFFVTVDGPNGAGKSTIVQLVCARLAKDGLVVMQTKEPTPRFNRNNENRRGAALAQLILDDRRIHLELDIEPALEQGTVVVCERYIDSSLVYRSLDGIPFEETWRENSHFRLPDLRLFIDAREAVLKERLQRRATRTRFEVEFTSKQERDTYLKAHAFLKEVGIPSILIQNSKKGSYNAVNAAYASISRAL